MEVLPRGMFCRTIAIAIGIGDLSRRMYLSFDCDHFDGRYTLGNVGVERLVQIQQRCHFILIGWVDILVDTVPSHLNLK